MTNLNITMSAPMHESCAYMSYAHISYACVRGDSIVQSSTIS